MVTREYVKTQIDILPEQALIRILDFVNFQKYQFGLSEDESDNETAYLLSIPGMLEKIEAASQEPLSEGVPVSELWSDV